MKSDAARRTDRTPRGLVAFIAFTMMVAGVGLIVVHWRYGLPQNLVALVVLSALGLVSQGLRESNIGQKVALSFLSIIQLASIPLVGPVGAALVGGLAQALDPNPVPLVRRIFNGAMTTTLGWTGGMAYLVAGGTLDLRVSGPGPLLLHVAVPLLVGDIVQMLVNAIFISGVLRAERGSPMKVTFVGMVSTSGLSYLGYGAIGFLFVVLWVPSGVGPFSAVLILAPLFVARWAIVQYGDEVRSHESALSALVTAVETKDPFAAGHSERVAIVVDWLIEPLGLSVQEVSDLRFAAMLHDVGKVSLPTRIVRRPGQLDAADLEVLASHAERGAELLSEVSFLEGSLGGIRHHHERWDGRGYPDGLSGEAIPMASRIIAVADAFDALTIPRTHRPAMSARGAVDEIGRRAGSQFDPKVVDALRRSIDRHEWPLAAARKAPDTSSRWAVDYFDHDDPVASDLYASAVDDNRVVRNGSCAG